MFLGVPKKVVVRLGWVTLSYGAVQFLRLVNNVILTRLLDPTIFGIMSLVIAIRVGMELISDVGVTQNIVSNPRGDDPAFYDTGWTLQAVRGIFLGGLCALLSAPVAHFFDHPELALILPIIAVSFIYGGLDSTARGLLYKQINVARMGMFEVAQAALAIVIYAAAALLFHNVWAVVVGLIATSAVTLICSFMYVPGLRHRFIFDADSARQLLHFGKWVYFSSIVYFFAMNFDRLYFAKQISLAELGIYGIARNLADVVSQLAVRGSSFVLYPTVAAAGLAPADLRKRLLRGRRTLLLAAAIGLGGIVALSDLIVELLYDPRYQEAGTILPVLCMGVWFAILTSTNDAILMGLSRPAYPAVSNATKLVTYLVGMPLAFHFYGFMGAVVVIAGGEVVKYLTLWALTHKEHLRFGRDDLALTIAFVLTAWGFRELVHLLGWNGNIHQIHPAAMLKAMGL
jgi:O-antigen/teichoic acid export membrane protein